MPNDKRYHVWAFNKLYQYVEYKAREHDIQVKQIDPKNTSRICSKCGHIDKNNRSKERFKCKKCGYELHADYNASKNIGIKLLQQRQKSSAGAGNGQLALKSGTLKLNGDYSPTFLSARLCLRMKGHSPVNRSEMEFTGNLFEFRRKILFFFLPQEFAIPVRSLGIRAISEFS
ncbi:MAG: zinc ribbon domain-containing protein [Thermoplasmatota archaeon]